MPIIRSLRLAISFLAVVPLAPSQDAPVWRMVDYGRRIGSAGLDVAATATGPEIVLTAYGDRLWMVLVPQATGYRQDFVSPVTSLSQPITCLRLADVLATAGPEVVLTTADGWVEVWHLASRTRQRRFATGHANPRAIAVGDLDGDGASELAVVTSSRLLVFRQDGSSLADVAGPGGTDVLIANLDADPAPEIATSSGHVLDGVTLGVEWQWAPAFGQRVLAADVDGDGRNELLAGEYSGWVWCYDIDLRLPQWALQIRPNGGNLGAMCLANIDADSNLELVVGDQQWAVTAFDTATQTMEWTMANPDSHTVGVAVGDADGDGVLEILWGTDAGSAKANLFVASAITRGIEWTSPEYDGPFLGPFLGDFDGDGNAELVTVTASHASTYQPGRVLVFDPITRVLRHESSPLSTSGQIATDAQAIDLDRDGDLELVVTHNRVEAVDWQHGAWRSLTVVTNSSRLGLLVDIDADGILDLLTTTVVGVGAARWPSGSGLWFRYTPWAPERLTTGDTDQDGRLEVLVAGQNGDVRTFDAASGNPEPVIAGTWNSVDAVALAPGLQFLAVGNRRGELALAVPNGSAYGLVGPLGFSSLPIRSVGFLPGTPWLLLSSQAGVSILDGLQPLWQSARIGTYVTRLPVVHWPSYTLFASSEVGLFAFRPR